MVFHRAKQIFVEAIKLAPEDRAAYLDEQCGDDADLRAEVDSLLVNQSSTVRDPSPERIAGEYQRGDTVAHFTIRDRLGVGGMGAVYLAEQSVPVKRRVALKVIKPGFDTRNTLARFQAERQALARMDHPCIAKVLEAGATDTGRPWFAMEYIKGEELLAYCDENKLDTKQRLKLFIKICGAIQHAHQRGIMHRDLKPGNILVTRGEDDQPQPKVIDFGIAKAISSDLTDMTLHTTIGQLVGTLAYMSPEQVRGSDDIDTRTDVYTLGVILYELISGQVPFSGETTSDSGQEAMKKSIREADPPKPSTQLSSVDNDEARAIAKARGTDTSSLQNTLRRELEWIPLKALRKDRGERYASPDDLAEDVQRYLDGEALEAGPVTRRYRFRKFMKRNKVPVITAASFVLVLLVATTGLLTLWMEATAATKTAKEQTTRAEDAATKEAQQRTLASQLAEAEEQARLTAEAREYSYWLYQAQHALKMGRPGTARVKLDQARRLLAPRESVPFEIGYLKQVVATPFPSGQATMDGESRQILALDNGLFAVAHEATVTLWRCNDNVTTENFIDCSTEVGPGDAAGGLLDYASTASILAFAAFDRVALIDLQDPGARAWLRHDSEITGVAINDNATWLAFTDSDGKTQVHDVSVRQDGQPIVPSATWQIPQDDITSLVFTPTGDHLVTGGLDGQLRTWDIEQQRLITSRKGHELGIDTLRFSGDGSRLASIDATGDMRVWSQETEALVHDFTGTEIMPDTLALSSDGQFVAGFSSPVDNPELTIWDADSGDVAWRPRSDTELTSIAFSSDGSHLAATTFNEGMLTWDLMMLDEAFRQNARFSPSAEFGASVCFSPDGQTIVSSDSGILRLWDAETLELLGPLDSYPRPAGVARFSPDGRRLRKGKRIWEWPTGTVVNGLPADILACTPDGMTWATWSDAAGDHSAQLVVHSARPGVDSIRLPVAHGYPSTCTFNTDGTTLLIRQNHMDHEGALVVAHDLQTGQVNQLELSIAAERFMSKAPGGGFLFQTRIDELTLTDNTLAIQGVYSLPDTEPIAWTKRTREPIRSVAFDVDGNYLAVLGYGWTSIQRIDLQSGHNESMLLEGHEDVVRAMTFSPDGRRLASGGDDGTVRIWDTRLGAELLLIEGNRHAIVDLAFSPDGSRLASASSDGVIRTYETRPPAQWARSQAAKRDRIESLKPIVARLVARPPDELATGLDLEKARFPADAPILDQLVFMALADSRNSLVHREVLASYEQEVQHSWDDPLLLHLLSGDWSYVRDNDPLRASPEVLKELRELSRRAAKRSCQLTDFQDVSNLRELVSVLERHHELEPDAGHDVEAAKYRQMLEEIRDVEATKYRQWLEETQKANSNATAEPAAP